MKRQSAILLAGILSVWLGACYSYARAEGPTETQTAPKPEGVGSATVLTLHGKIVAVDKAKKVVIVEDPGGRKAALNVQNPYNLEAAKVGDPVVAHFYEIVTIRKKKPGEVVPSASLKEGIVTAKPGETPGAAVGRKMQLVVSVVEIDAANGTVTVKGPDGALEKVKARDPNNLKLIKVGDELVVSIARAVAVSIDKESAS